jgi:hypothetical protein
MDIDRPTAARRNRMTAIASGVITVIAITLGFAGDLLGPPWHWMRPAAELLLLTEPVGLVALERPQLFEPVHDQGRRYTGSEGRNARDADRECACLWTGN